MNDNNNSTAIIANDKGNIAQAVVFDEGEAKRAFDYLPISETTRDDYKLRVGEFIDFIKANGVNRNTMLDYRKYLEQRTDYSISTKNKYFTTAKRYCGVLYNAHILPMDITKDLSGAELKGFKQSRLHKKDGVSQAEVDRLAEYFRGLDENKQNLRLKAIFSLLIYQGLRQVEIVRLDVNDLDLRAGKAFVQGKGRDDKEPIALHPYTVNALRAYLTAYKKKSGAVFTCESNRAYGERLTTLSLRRIVKGVLRVLGVENSTHGFRHYFTTNLIKNYKGDLLTVAHYTRHRRLDMLQVYNDAINAEQDLPRYINAFEGVKL